MSKKLHFQLLILLILDFSDQTECRCDQLEENDCKYAKSCKLDQNQCQLKSCQDYSTSECNYIIDCILENNRCVNHPWTTCKDIPIEVCSQRNECAINNENKCSEFTKCEDYIINNDQDCIQKSEDCYNGLDGYCKSKIEIEDCSDVQKDCEKYKVKDKKYCVTSTDNKCVSIQVNQCSNMNGIPACSLYKECNWNISTSICREIRCNDLNQQNCNRSLQSLNGDTIICYWNNDNNQCLRMSFTDELSETNCYQSTNGQNTWKEGKCQECSKLSELVILINFLIYLL